MPQSDQRSATSRSRAQATLVGLASALALMIGVLVAPPPAEAAPGDVSLFEAAIPSVASDSDTQAVELGCHVHPLG